MLFRLTSSDDLRNLLIFGTTTACSALTWMNKCQIRAKPSGFNGCNIMTPCQLTISEFASKASHNFKV